MVIDLYEKYLAKLKESVRVPRTAAAILHLFSGWLSLCAPEGAAGE
jgi:deoxycytidine triphosphate deaminase